MNAGELYSLFRADIVDDVEPYLWSDTEIYAYMNDAYFMFVRLTGGIPDGSSPVTMLTATEGEATTRLDSSIMRIHTATNLTDNNREVKVINVQDVEGLTSEDYGVIRNVNRVTTSGSVCYMIIGEEEEIVRWVQVPAATANIQLVVERLPLNRVSKDTDCFTDVRSEHHFHLMKWMRHLAYRKQDADAFNLIKSDQERADFIAYCELAKGEKATRRHKVRVTAYGGL